jgi:hypothetical protein
MIVLIDEMSFSKTCAQTTDHSAVNARVTPRWSRNQHFLAIIDAAHEVGWSFVEGKSTKLSVDEEVFPAMTFRASSATLMSEDEAKAFWIASKVTERFERPFLNTMAVECERLFHYLTVRRAMAHVCSAHWRKIRYARIS